MIDTVKIGGLTSYATESVTYNQNAREEREYAQVTIQNNRKERYEAYTLVELFDDDELKYQYLVQSDQKRELRDGYFQHTLQCVELMAIFDTVIPASRSFRTRTGDKYIIRDILNVYKRELAFYNKLYIDYEEGPYLDEELNEKEYEGVFSNTLINIFHAIRSNPKARYENNTYILYPQPYETRNNMIDGESDTYYTEENNLNYATKAKVQAKNAKNKQVSLDWFPAEDGYIKPRAEGYVLSETKLQYELDSNILAIRKVYARAKIATSLQTAYIDVDITNHVFTEQEYNALPDVSTFDQQLGINKLNSVKYDIDNNIIYNLWSTESWWTFERNIRHLINAIQYEWNQENYVGELPEKEEGETWGYVDEDTRDTGIKVQYVKQRDIDYIVNRVNSKNMNVSQMLYSQTASRVNLAKQKENMALLSNRLGNNTEYRTRMFDTGEYVWQVFDYTSDDKVIVDAKYTEHATGIYGEFELAENFANVKAEESITRSPDPYTITGKAFQTNVIQENYIVLDTSSVTNDTILSDRGIDAVRELFDTTPDSSKKIEYGVYKGPLEEPIHMAIMSEGAGQTATYHVAFKKPILAGWYLDEVDDLRVKQPVIYTDEAPTFRLDNFRLYLSSGGLITDEGFYPIIDEFDTIIDNALTREEIKPIDLGINDGLAYTLNLHATTRDDRIIIGNRYMELLPLHNIDERDFKVYKSDRPYIQGQQKPRDSDTLLFGGEIINNKTDQKITIIAEEPFDYWAIVESEKIVVAGNNTDYFNYGVKDIDGTANIPEIYKETIVLYSEIGISASVDYNAKKLRKISASADSDLSIGLTVDYIARKLNSISTEVNSDLVISVEVSYTTTKPNNINVAPQADLGLSAETTYTIFKPKYLTESISSGLGISADVSYNKTEYSGEWDYIGTSGTSDDNVNAGTDETSCRSSSEIETWLKSNYPPENYEKGFVMRVDHAAESNGSLLPCSSYYYEAK